MADQLATLVNAMAAPRQSDEPPIDIEALIAASPNFANNPVIDQMTATAQRSRPEPQTVDEFIRQALSR